MERIKFDTIASQLKIGIEEINSLFFIELNDLFLISQIQALLLLVTNIASSVLYKTALMDIALITSGCISLDFFPINDTL